MNNEIKINFSNERNRDHFIKKMKGVLRAAALGAVAGLTFYGLTVTITGGVGLLLGSLVSEILVSLFGGAIVGGVVGCGYEVIKSQKKEPEESSLVPEEQIIILTTNAGNIKACGDYDFNNITKLISRAQYYWVGNYSEWKEMEENFQLKGEENNIPDDDSVRVIVVYEIEKNTPKLPFERGKLKSYFRRYNEMHDIKGKRGGLYRHRLTDDENKKYNFKR